MTLTSRVLIALVTGLAAGVAISSSGSAALLAIPVYLEPIGTIWVNALRMTVIPLVVSSILIGVGSLPDSRGIGRIGGRAVMLFFVTLAAAAAFALIVGPLVLAPLRIDPASADMLRAQAEGASGQATQSAQKIAGFGQWLVDLVPTNPVRAAADGAMLPLIMFTLLLGIAMTRIADQSRALLMRLAQGVNAASMVLVGWVLVAAPLGVFALSAPLATRLGVAAAGAVVYYIVSASAMNAIFTALMYVAAWSLGKAKVRTFARAAAPAQAVAFSARSSVVALPALLRGADAELHLPLPIRSFFLPLASAVFRAGSAVMLPFAVLFIAKLYNVDLSGPQLVTVGLTTILTTFSVPGIPGGSIIVMVPVLLAVGLPVGAVGVLLGVDTIPDMFRTTTHVTADMAAATILARFEPAED